MAGCAPPSADEADGAQDARPLLVDLIHSLDVLLKDCRVAVLRPVRELSQQEAGGRLQSDHVREAAAKIRRAESEVRAAIAIMAMSRSDLVRRSSSNPPFGADESLELEDPVGERCEEELSCGWCRRSHRWRRQQRDKEMWKTFDKARDYDFFRDILIAHDGGFSEVDALWSGWRWFSAILLVIFIISNVYAVIVQDVHIIGWGGHEFDNTIFLNQTILRWLWLNKIHVNGSRTICFLELLGLAYVAGRNLLVFLQLLLPHDELSKWKAIERLSWKTLPQLSTYSGMRLLHFVSPSVLLADFFKHVDNSRAMWTTYRLVAWKWARFVLSRLGIFIIGLDSLLVKVHQAHASFVSDDGSLSFRGFWTLCVFVVQVMGIVQLPQVVMDRLFLFIFGGENAVMEPHEQSLMSVWKAMLARQIWRQYSTVKFVIIMLTFSDADFQKLVLNERGILPAETDASDLEPEPVSADGAESDCS